MLKDSSAVRKHLATAATLALVLLATLGVTGSQIGCKSTCSDSEANACTNTYTDCVAKAAATADLATCQRCVDDYCSCYDSCGNSCDKDKLKGSCTGT